MAYCQLYLKKRLGKSTFIFTFTNKKEFYGFKQ